MMRFLDSNLEMIISNLEMISSIQKDVHRSDSNVTPFYMRKLSI